MACERDAQGRHSRREGAPSLLECGWTTQYTPETLITLIDIQTISQDDLSGLVHLK